MPHPIPDGFTAITPYLVIDNVEAEIAFLTDVFGATTVGAMPGGPGGPIVHAEMSVNGARVMMGRAHGPFKALPALIYVYVTDVDATFEHASRHPGVNVEQPVNNQFYGDRSGTVKTANGIMWSIASRIENVSHEELVKRMQGMKK